jgi:multicomponent Na+:H+ antiporter subunit F
MGTVSVVAFAILAVCAVLCVARVAAGPSLADRVIALDSLLIVGVAGVAVESARTRSGVYLDVLLVVALVAFIGTTAAARFIERKGIR